MSLLSDVKVLLGVPDDYSPFDAELMLHINTALTMAWQIGFTIPEWTLQSSIESTTDWGDVFKPHLIALAKEWLSLRVRSVWDPPQGSAKDAVDGRLEEVETRMQWAVQTPALGGDSS